MSGTYETFDDFVKTANLSHWDPGTYTAQLAWNAALRRVHELLIAGSQAESDMAGLVTLITTEIECMDTGERGDFEEKLEDPGQDGPTQ